MTHIPFKTLPSIRHPQGFDKINERVIDNEITPIENPDEIVIKDENIKIIFDYPMRLEAVFDFHHPGGFSRMHLIRFIKDTYRKIYDEEEKTTTMQVLPINQRKRLLNRNETNGKYCIYGHDIDDLYIESIHYDPEFSIVSLGIGS